MTNGLEELESLMANYYEMCRDLGNNDDQYQKWNLTSERGIIEKELKSLKIIKDKIGIHWQEILKLWLKNKLISQEEYDLLREVLL